jgi:LysR family transcriptional regulator, regulator of abg operon
MAPTMNIKTHHLRDLLAVADRGSISAAAKHLGISQPALSRSIHDLERILAAPLLERTARGALLTTLGALFVRRARASVAELLRAQEEVAQHLGSEEGHVTACLSSVSHIALMPGALPKFCIRYPGVRLRIIEGTYLIHESKLLDGTIDFYVGPVPGRGTAPGLQVHKLFDNTRWIYARRGHPRAKARSLRDLVDADWITTSLTEKPEQEFDAIFARHGLPAPRIVLQAESALTWITAVASSDMLSLTARQFAASPMVRSVIERIAIHEALEAPPIMRVQRSSIPLTPAAQHFSDLLEREARRQLPK